MGIDNTHSRATGIRAALYARVSTLEQEPENQLAELRRYVQARGWTAAEYVDRGVSGAKDRRPGLDTLTRAAKRRHVDVVIVWALDRFGRSLHHLVTAIKELDAAGVAFISLRESIDTSSPTGRLLLGVMGSFAEFERARIVERVNAGLARAKRQGKRLGRPRTAVALDRLAAVADLSNREAATRLGVSLATLKRWRRRAHESVASAA